MVQYSCCQCVWLNWLLCSQYWQELLKHTLRNQTLIFWAPNIPFEALKILKFFTFLPVTDSLFLQFFLYNHQEQNWSKFWFPRVPAESRELPDSGKYSWFGPVLERRRFSQTRNTFVFWVEGNFLPLNISVPSFVAQIFLENSSELSKSSSHLPPTSLSLLTTVIK